MREYLGDYIKDVDDKIKNKNVTEKDIENHLIKIKFFQHERLIHLYGIFLFLSVIIFTQIWIFVIVIYIALIFLLFYVRHYFFLENHVQYLYKEYDQMKNILEENAK